MKILSSCAVFAFIISNVLSLTVNEAGQFFNSRRYGGFVTVTENENFFIIQSNGLPDHAPDTVNPSQAIPRGNVFGVPKNPTVAEIPGCLPMGPIAISRTGALIFNPLNREEQNAVEGDTAEQLDTCNGHPDPMGVYHYHALPKNCLYKGDMDELIGVARDGFPIYGPLASDLGREVINADLDKCHGRFVNGEYRYYATNEFPYFLGCFKGNLPQRFDSLNTVCNETSAFDDKWGYLCHCRRPNGLPGTGRPGPFPQRNDGERNPAVIGFIPGQGPTGTRQMPLGPIGGQMPGQGLPPPRVVRGPNGQPVVIGNQVQIGPNGQPIVTRNQVQLGPDGQPIPSGNQIQIGPNGQIINRGNPIQMGVIGGTAAAGGVPGQRPVPLGFLPSQQQVEGEQVTNGESQIQGSPNGQTVAAGNQIQIGPNGQIINRGNPIQMGVIGGTAASGGAPVQGPRPLGFLPSQQDENVLNTNTGNQLTGIQNGQPVTTRNQLQVGPGGQIINRGNPIQMGVIDGNASPGALPNQGSRPLGFLPSQQQVEGANPNSQVQIGPTGQPVATGNPIQIGPNGQPIATRNQIQIGPNGQPIFVRNPVQIGPNGQPVAIGNQFQIGPNGQIINRGNPIQMGITGGPAVPGAISGQRPLGFSPTSPQIDGQQFPGFGTNANGRQTLPRFQPGNNLEREAPLPFFSQNPNQEGGGQPVNGASEEVEEPRPVNGVTQDGEPIRPVNGGEQPLPIFVNGVPQNAEQPRTRFVRTQNGQVIPVLVNPTQQTGQTLNIPRISQPMAGNPGLPGRNFGQPPMTFLTPNGPMMTNNPQATGQRPVIGPPLMGPLNGVTGRGGPGQTARVGPQPPATIDNGGLPLNPQQEKNQGGTQPIEGLEILDGSMQNRRGVDTQSPQTSRRTQFDRTFGPTQRTQYGKYRLFNMYLQNNL